MLAPGLVVIGQTEQVVLLCPRTALVILQDRLYLRRIGEQMLPFGIEGALQEGSHTDVGFEDANLCLGVFNILAVLLLQRVVDFLLPLHLILTDNGIHQQGHLVVDERLTRSLGCPDADDERGRLHLAVTVLGSQTCGNGTQHGQSCHQRGLTEL